MSLRRGSAPAAPLPLPASGNASGSPQCGPHRRPVPCPTPTQMGTPEWALGWLGVLTIPRRGWGLEGWVRVRGHRCSQDWLPDALALSRGSRRISGSPTVTTVIQAHGGSWGPYPPLGPPCGGHGAPCSCAAAPPGDFCSGDSAIWPRPSLEDSLWVTEPSSQGGVRPSAGSPGTALGAVSFQHSRRLRYGK